MTVASSEETFEGTGGLRIFVRSWRPQGTPRPALVICHGVNSHGGQYRWPAERFANGGLVVHALDLRGRGRSEGERFYVAGTVRIAKSRDPGLPLFLLSHSAGGVASAIWSKRRRELGVKARARARRVSLGHPLALRVAQPASTLAS